MPSEDGRSVGTHRLGDVEDDGHDPLRVRRLGLQRLAVLGAPHAGQDEEAALVRQVQRRVPADAWAKWWADGLVGLGGKAPVVGYCSDGRNT